MLKGSDRLSVRTGDLISTSQLILLGLSLQFFSGQSHPNPERFEPQVVNILIPAGPSDQDSPTIVVEYQLNSPCEEIARVRVFPHPDHPRVLQLLSEATRQVGVECRDEPTTLRKEVALGQMNLGNYQLRNYHRLHQKFGEFQVYQRNPEDPGLQHGLALHLDLHP